ncbi:hypothetical protein [Streptomyces sp. NBC_00986]|uniref:hypothetical protein n=1 Tax=Streptomyces sp. NBC_00986 TaxID=2903702 RepID=UPI00386D36BF|nr:hypothetical protein OG504_45135 [Streptomyces sp. NBC_00986]
MKRSVYNHVRAKASLAIAARTTATNGTAVDRMLSGASGANEWHQSVMLLVHTGTITDGTHVITLEVSDDNSSWAAAAAGDVQGTLPTIAATDDDKLYEVGYTGTKRYLRAVTTPSGVTSGGVYGAVILLGFPNTLPISRT